MKVKITILVDIEPFPNDNKEDVKEKVAKDLDNLFVGNTYYQYDYNPFYNLTIEPYKETKQ